MNTDTSIERHIVLIEPEVHWNTGNIGRTCLGANTPLHLIKPLGFSLESKQVKRAGLDYWHDVDLYVWDSFDAFHTELAPTSNEIALFAKKGSKSFLTMPDTRRLFLIFGSETKGLPESVLTRYSNAVYHIPVSDRIRCLNLSTAVGIALYESLRNIQSWHGWE